MTVVYDAIHLAFRLYTFMIIARVFMSWLPIDPYSKVVRFISDVTDPFLGFLERYMPSVLLSPLNFTPIVAIFLLSILESVVATVFRQLFALSLL